MTGSIRDRQRQKVYNAERVAFVGPPDAPNLPPDYKTVPQCQAYVDRIVGSEAWRALGFSHLGLFGWSPVTVKDGRMRRRGGADSFDNTISMPRWTRVNYYILHELAHIANDYIHNFDYSEDYEGGGAWPGYTDPDTGEDVLTQRVAAHGPEYCGVYLYLVRAFMGDEAHDSLAASFANYKVKVAPVRVATRNVADKETPVTVMDTPVTDTDTPVSTAPDELSVTDTDTRCRECGQRLGSRQAFCSDRCRWTYHNRLRHERGAGDREKVCESCGAAFTAKRADARTCSPACRQKLHRTRSR